MTSSPEDPPAARFLRPARTSELADIYTVRQGEPLGLGHAVGTAASHVGPENAFAVLLGDEFVEEDKPLLPQMLDLQAETGGIVLALMEVAPEETSRYGIASVETTDTEDVVRITGLVEKPKPEDSPSNLAVLGRYVLPGKIFETIGDTKPGAGGEIQLTDAMATLLAEGTPVHGIVYRGHRYDTGMPLGYLQAVVQLAVQRPDLGEEFRAWLTEFVGGQKG